MDPLELRVFIYMYFTNLVNQKNATYDDMALEFSDNVLGTLNLTDVIITGLDTIEINIQNIVVTEDEDNNNDLCLILPVGYLTFALNYIADIGIDDEIPIYGDGIFSYSMTNVKFNVCMFINFNERYLDDVIFQSTYRHGPVEITGFWKNEQVSLILECILNIINRFIAMWSNYEPERASCIGSPFMSYTLNILFGNENATFEFDPTCFEKILFDGIEEDVVTNLEEHVLRKMTEDQENYESDITLNTFVEENKSSVLEMIQYIGQILSRIF